jgi:NADH-quinone oxidoreductase subunit K
MCVSTGYSFMYIKQILINTILFLIGLIGLTSNRRNILISLMCIELILLSLNLNFITFSIYLDDVYGQIFSLLILTVAASESALGLAIIIIYYRIRGSILSNQQFLLKK